MRFHGFLSRRTPSRLPAHIVGQHACSRNLLRRCLQSVCGAVALFAVALSARGQTIAAAQFPGTTAVGQQSGTLLIPVNITQSAASGTIQVLTQGVPNLDFQATGSGTCGTGPYTANTLCKVAVTFTPKYPGLRSGAVVITAGNVVVGRTMLTATATGGLSVLVPGLIQTVAGDGQWLFTGDNALATQTPFYLPGGVVADAAGNLYISDTNNQRIRRVDAGTGLVTTVGGNGNPGYSGDGGPATAAQLSSPANLAIDGAGDLYFADTGNHAIRRIDAVTGIITTVVGTPGVQGYAGDGGLATSAKLSLPEGLAFDAGYALYIADTGNNVVRRVDATTGIITTVAGTGVIGYLGDGGAATSARLNEPWNITVAADGSLYIADSSNNAIRRVSAGTITTIAGNGTAGYAGDDGPASAAVLNAPTALAFDPAGDLYIADSANNRVRKIYAATGKIETISGTTSEQFLGDNEPASTASLYGPYALFLDQLGDLFIADIFHNRIRVISATSDTITYPTMRVGKLSAPFAESLENDGNDTMTLSAAVFNQSAFDPATTTCNTGLVISTGTACSMGVVFAPTTVANPDSGTLQQPSDAGNSPALLHLTGEVLSVEPTTIALTSSLNPSLVGNNVAFTAQVTSASTTLTGTVVFNDGATQLCSVTISATGGATCSSTALTLGSHNITANYSGDDNDAAANSTVLVQVVHQSSTTSLTASPNPVTITNSVALTATVTAATGTPTGNVTFYNGTTALGSVALNGSGIAIYNTTALPAGTDALTAVYAGDSLNAGSTSSVVNEVVNLATTTTTVTTSNATVVVGTSLLFSATVTSPNGPTPTGTVEFIANGTPLGTGTLSGTGTASFSTAALTPGSYTVVAKYMGDTDNATSTSTPLTQTVQQIGTVTTLGSDATPTTAGATIHLTATVVMQSGATADGTITGNVTFYDGTTALGTASVNASGVATLAVSTLNAATHALTATYAGNTNYATSTSAALSEIVHNTATTTTLSESASNTIEGKPVTFNISVTSNTGSGTPTGSVVLQMDGATLTTLTLNAQSAASYTTSSLAAGTHTFTAIYQGDSSYLTSTSTSIQEIVALANTAIALAGPTGAVNAGTTLSLVATLTTNGLAPTGTVTLRDGSVAISQQTISTQTASGTGTFNFSTSSLAVGTHALTAAYSGDSNNAAAVSTPVNVTIQPGPTTTTLTTSANPSTLNQSVTLQAVVTSPSPSIGGSVAFLDGTQTLGSATVNGSGVATLALSTLALGPHTLTANYIGDTNHAASTSNTVNELIVQTSTAAISSSVNPSVSGQSITFTAKILGVGTLIPTGSVTLLDGSTTLATVPLDATGTASYAISSLTVASHTITVVYPGDTNYAASHASLTQTVESASTQIALTASANPATYGSAVTFTATITSNGSIATGNVSFTDGTTTLGTGTLNASGVATFTTSSLAPGAHTIVANYAGDGRASASVSTPVNLVVLETTSVTLTSSANPTLTLSPITLTASVRNAGVGTPTGTITFTDGTTTLGTVSLSSGAASLTVPQLSAATHNIVASYTGDSDNAAATSSTLAQVVQLRPTGVVLTSSVTDPTNQQLVTLIAVIRWTGPQTPTGTVTFANGSATIGTVAVDSNGVGTITVQLNNPTESLTATYNGDTAYAPSTSPQTDVGGGKASQFTMTLSPNTATIVTKQHTSITVTLTSVSSFSDTMQFGCLGLPTAATCTFSSPSATLASNGSAAVTLTIDTGNPLGSGAQAHNRPPFSPVQRTTLALLPGALLAAFLLRRRRSALTLLGALLLMMATLQTTGCGSLQINGTPPGTYTFKVTASGTGTGATQSQVMTLNVTQ
jgi:hypothetical protein